MCAEHYVSISNAHTRYALSSTEKYIVVLYCTLASDMIDGTWPVFLQRVSRAENNAAKKKCFPHRKAKQRIAERSTSAKMECLRFKPDSKVAKLTVIIFKGATCVCVCVCVFYNFYCKMGHILGNWGHPASSVPGLRPQLFYHETFPGKHISGILAMSDKTS